MRVLLVNTNRMKPPVAPLGLDYVGSALTAHGHETAILDLCLEADGEAAMRSAFHTENYDLVALTFRNTDDCYFASGQSFVNVLRRDVRNIRRHHEGPLVIGGCGFSLMPEQLLNHAGAELGVAGDGEVPLPGLLDALQGKRSLGEVPSLVFKQRGEWRRNRRYAGSPAGLDLASRRTVDNRTYFRRGGQIGIETKRGCPRRCIYCADPVVKGRMSRLRPPAEVVSEIRNLLAAGADCLHFCDSEFNVPPDHAEAVCRAILDAGLQDRIRWYTYASPVPFTEALAGLMVRAGCAGIDFGADNGSDAQLHALGREYGRKELTETARICRNAGIVFMYDLLLGAPGETQQTLAETIELMKALSPDRVGVSLGVRVYPGTPLEKTVREGKAEPAGVIGDVGGIEPVYFVSPALGPNPLESLRELTGGDPRFFLPAGPEAQDYNYNDNMRLQQAIDAGCRGAYWDILRRLADAP